MAGNRVDLVNTFAPALLTDQYELTMVSAALRDGTADRRCVFEVFARRLPGGRRYGVVAGPRRLVELLRDFRFDPAEVDFLRGAGIVDATTAAWLTGYRFTGDIDGYAEGELFFPGSPILTVAGTFAECVVLETLILSVLNHDCAIAAAAARMVTAARGRPIIEMGSRRTHEDAAVAAARAAYLAGFASTSNLAAGARYGIPTTGTSAHAFTLLHDDEPAAFASQVAALGKNTTLLVDTYDISQGIRNAIAVAGPGLRAIRIDSGDLSVLAQQSRELLDSLGATEGWSTSSSRSRGGRWSSARRTRPRWAGARPPYAGTSRPARPPRRSWCPRACPTTPPTTGCCSGRTWPAARSSSRRHSPNPAITSASA
jgi:nicotinate phosphoribosyltransferase